MQYLHLRDIKSKHKNIGRPNNVTRQDPTEKCTFRIRIQNQPDRIIVSSTVCSARLGRPSNLAQTATDRFPTISRNSAIRKNAKARGRGKSSAKFFVQPSRSCAKLRYMRVQTASPP